MNKRLNQLLINRDTLSVEELSHHPPFDIAQEIKSISLKDQILLMDMMPIKQSSKVLKHMNTEEQHRILIHLSVDKAKTLLNLQPIDDLVDLFLFIHPRQEEKLMEYLDKAKQQKVKDLMKFKPETAGSLVTSDYISAKDSWSVETTLEHIRKFASNVESISYIYILDNYGQLTGIVSIRELLIAPAKEILSNIMIQDVISVYVEVDQKEVVKKLTNNNLSAIPVTTISNKMIGIITFDDVMDVMEEEATEDIQKLGGSEPLSKPYFETSIWKVYSKRLPWLLLLFIAEAYTGTVLHHFEDSLEKVVALAFFIPLLVGTGGNTGTQVVATVIRAIGLGEVKFKDIFRVIKKEALIGILLGLTLGVAGIIRAYMLGVGTEVAQVVAITLFFIVLWASIVAALLPLILRKLKLDPAVVSGPFITTLVDGTGLVIYFLIAKMLLNI
ncbi:magnesium transporter [Bacillus cereus]|uniref:magnesium transporter n=1 Tax=Bacillus cereus TaxID=1396 RepID=UPI002D798845|nr:magnesium transporter [Bacillus cereus]